MEQTHWDPQRFYINRHQENFLSISIYILVVQSKETPITVF